MLILLSPAKLQNFKHQNFVNEYSLPDFLNLSAELVEEMRQLSAYELSKLLEINAKLAQLNVERYSNWHLPFTPQNAKQAVYVFNGEVFNGLDAKSLSESDAKYMQSHLRIISGLYGLLRPLDLIQPYRLEMATKLPYGKVGDLYHFWSAVVTKAVKNALIVSGNPQVILNLSSGEYFKTLNHKNLKANVIDVEFFETKNDKLKTIVVYTKKARGLMARYVIENKIENPEDLKGFSADGYWFCENLSTETKLVFSR